MSKDYTSIHKVSDENRLDFLPFYFGYHTQVVENMLFNIAQEFIEEYEKGYWDFFKIDIIDPKLPSSEAKSIPLLVWQEEQEVTLLLVNYQKEVVVRGLVASVALNLMVFSHLASYFYEKNEKMTDVCTNIYHDLNQWVFSEENTLFTKEELTTINNFID